MYIIYVCIIYVYVHLKRFFVVTHTNRFLLNKPAFFGLLYARVALNSYKLINIFRFNAKIGRRVDFDILLRFSGT